MFFAVAHQVCPELHCQCKCSYNLTHISDSSFPPFAAAMPLKVSKRLVALSKALQDFMGLAKCLSYGASTAKTTPGCGNKSRVQLRLSGDRS